MSVFVLFKMKIVSVTILQLYFSREIEADFVAVTSITSYTTSFKDLVFDNCVFNFSIEKPAFLCSSLNHFAQPLVSIDAELCLFDLDVCFFSQFCLLTQVVPPTPLANKIVLLYTNLSPCGFDV